jgi:hypothetical protein
MDKANYETVNSIVRGIVERAVSSLMVVGMAHDNACALLMIQGAVRIDDAAKVKETIKSIEMDLE